jgi:hypothetical protein
MAGALGLVAALGCGGGDSSSSSTSTTESQTATTIAQARFTATLEAPGHHPIAGAPWPITIRARSPGGRPLRATVGYQYLFAGQVVGRRSHYRFRGTFDDLIRWPARSAGYPLTFRAVVKTALGTRMLDYPVQVRP